MIYIQYMYHLYPAAKSKKSQDLLGGLRGLHGQRPGQSADRRDHLLGTSTGDHLQPGHRNLGGFQTGNIWGRRENSWKRRLTGDFGRNLGTLYIFFDNWMRKDILEDQKSLGNLVEYHDSRRNLDVYIVFKLLWFNIDITQIDLTWFNTMDRILTTWQPSIIRNTFCFLLGEGSKTDWRLVELVHTKTWNDGRPGCWRDGICGKHVGMKTWYTMYPIFTVMKIHLPAIYKGFGPVCPCGFC